MIDLNFRDYLKASRSKDAIEYYKQIFGDDVGVALTYHLKTKHFESASKYFKVVNDINEMTWGQFIAAEVLLTGSEEAVDVLDKISLIVIRPKGEDYFSNDNEEIESAHKEAVLSSDARMITEEIERFKELRDDFIKNKYRGVFYVVNRDGEELTEDEVSGNDTTMDEFVRQWYWYAITRDLAEENIVINKEQGMSAFENALNTKMSAIAPDIAYKRHKQILEEIEEKRRQINDK